jgi:hypothetical protein
MHMEYYIIMKGYRYTTICDMGTSYVLYEQKCLIVCRYDTVLTNNVTDDMVMYLHPKFAQP